MSKETKIIIIEGDLRTVLDALTDCGDLDIQMELEQEYQSLKRRWFEASQEVAHES